MKNEIERITPGNTKYPSLLKEIRNFPKELYCFGNIRLLNNRTIGVVGSRRTTQYGRNTAYTLSKRISKRGVTVVSGMAMGIDSFAHEGALKGNGSTIAVLGCGVDICYPQNNAELKRKIENEGLIISEKLIVVQAGNNSGALITAELAEEQGREVYSIPGNIDSEYNLGSNKLIKEGVSPLITVEEVIEIMGLDEITMEEASEILSETEKKIYMIIREHGEISVDELSVLVSVPVRILNGIVAVMEIKGVLLSALGKVFIANA